VALGRVHRIVWSRQAGWSRTRFDLPLLLFLVSAAIGAWLAFDPEAASAKFWQIVGGVALFDSLVFAPQQVRILDRKFSPVRALLLLLPALIAGYSLLTNDWASQPGKIPALTPAMAWFGSWQPDLSADRLHANVAGGLIAALLPLQIAAAAGLALGLALVGLAAVGLVMSASRGAWVALAIVGAVWLVWRLWGQGWRRRTWLILAGLVAISCALGAAIVWNLGVLLGPGGRLEVLRNSVDLALDYPFTGIGLGKGVFDMVYSSYVLIAHDPYIPHSHNLVLNIWLGQGLLGILAFIWLLVAAVQARGRSVLWRSAALASIGVMLIHGMVDDPFYSSSGVLLMFVPFAVLARNEVGVATEPAEQRSRAILALGLALLLLAALLAPARAAFQANVGAILQTRAELSVYEWPKWPIQDALRRSSDVDLARAIARYQAALALDPANATANRRLGQIELSQGQYEAAREHLIAAYAAAPGQRATRHLLGESYALTGEPDRATVLWSELDIKRGQLAGRAWWYTHIGEKQHAEAIQTLERLLAP
jgi:O-antigen ligase